jgi:hypothetical protein
MLCTEARTSFEATAPAPISLHHEAPPVSIPHGHVGPVVLPGSGKLIWWTGRVAIGLRHQPQRQHGMPSSSALWVQDLLLAA